MSDVNQDGNEDFIVTGDGVPNHVYSYDKNSDPCLNIFEGVADTDDVGVDTPMASHWLTKASQSGHADAQFQPGNLLAEGGPGVIESVPEAEKWWLHLESEESEVCADEEEGSGNVLLHPIGGSDQGVLFIEESNDVLSESSAGSDEGALYEDESDDVILSAEGVPREQELSMHELLSGSDEGVSFEVQSDDVPSEPSDGSDEGVSFEEESDDLILRDGLILSDDLIA